MSSNVTQCVHRSFTLRLIAHKGLLVVHHGIDGYLLAEEGRDDRDGRLFPGLECRHVLADGEGCLCFWRQVRVIPFLSRPANPRSIVQLLDQSFLSQDQKKLVNFRLGTQCASESGKSLVICI